MAACLFAPQSRVAFKHDTTIRGFIYDWFDGNRDIPAGRNLYSVQWNGVSGQYWYYDSELIAEADVPKVESVKVEPKTNKIDDKLEEKVVSIKVLDRDVINNFISDIKFGPTV